MSAVVSAIIAATVAIVVAFLGARWDTRRQAERLRHELQMETQQRVHELQLETERRQQAIELQEQRLSAELRTEYMAEAAISQLLWKAEPLRSFDRIKSRIGGFDDDELRRLLVRPGALRYTSTDGKNTELWGLRDRNDP